MKTTHTPLPWHRPAGPGALFSGKDGRLLCEMHEGGGGMLGVSKSESEANAAFIVRACNNHYLMLEALEASDRAIIQLCGTANTLSEKLGLGRKVRAEDFADKARAAILKAKG